MMNWNTIKINEEIASNDASAENKKPKTGKRPAGILKPSNINDLIAQGNHPFENNTFPKTEDAGAGDDYDQRPRPPKSSGLFLRALWKMIDDPECDKIISWDKKNTQAFRIHDLNVFRTETLKKYYSAKFNSFRRQLYFYGFKGQREVVWRHGELNYRISSTLEQVSRVKNKPTKRQLEELIFSTMGSMPTLPTMPYNMMFPPQFLSHPALAPFSSSSTSPFTSPPLNIQSMMKMMPQPSSQMQPPIMHMKQSLITNQNKAQSPMMPMLPMMPMMPPVFISPPNNVRLKEPQAKRMKMEELLKSKSTEQEVISLKTEPADPSPLATESILQTPIVPITTTTTKKKAAKKSKRGRKRKKKSSTESKAKKN